MALRLTALLVIVAAALIGCTDSSAEHAAPKPTEAAPAEKKSVAEDASSEPNVPTEDLKALVEGNNAFAIGLYKKIAEKEKGNIVFSPHSIHTALAMTYAGARGDTAKEMAKVLGFGLLTQEKVHACQHSLARKLSHNWNVGKQEFRSSNSLWLNKKSHFEADFLHIARTSYEAQANNVDFESAPEAAVGAINNWVAKETNERIRQLLMNDDVPQGTRLVLVNATFLKGLWQYPFDKTKTIEGDFHTSPERTVKAKMMQQKLMAYFWEGEGLKVASIPYQNNTASMMLIVPDQIDGLDALENKLTAKMMKTWYTGQAEVSLTLHLPRCTARNKRDLAPSLAAIGMAKPFGDNCDLRGISAEFGRISKVVHEAVIEVNEEGAEAAAATAVVGVQPVTERVIPKSRELNVDRPFCFAIYNHTTQSILFIARIVNPN